MHFTKCMPSFWKVWWNWKVETIEPQWLLVHYNNFGGDLETYTCIYWTENVEEPNQEQPILFSATANVCQVSIRPHPAVFVLSCCSKSTLNCSCVKDHCITIGL